MYRRLILVLVGVALIGACGFDNRKGYYYDNHRLNYVRLEKFKGSGGLNINQPAVFSEPEISTILKTIEIKKGSAFSKDEKIKKLFDSYSIGKLTPAIVKAFADVTPNQRVGFQFLIKDPKFILRNDRLTGGAMWVEDGKLHIDFKVIAAKVTGDIDKRGIYLTRRAQQARGLHTTLALGPGQVYGDSTQELVFDRAVYATLTEERVKREKELAEKGVQEDLKIKVIRDKSSTERLKELKVLRKERMISKEEYELKRKEILGEL